MKKALEKIKLLDDSPGVYLMRNENNEIIYVGKAKSLKKRVVQYFTRPQEGKTQKMVAEAQDFDFIVTNSEKEALLLEMNLIHRHMPRYNIRLKDDASYPYIKVQNRDPIVSISRNCRDKNARYYGPFPSATSAYETVALLKRVFPLQQCARPKRPCLYCEMGECLGPRNEPGFAEKLNDVLNRLYRFMNGDVSEVKKELTAKMRRFSDLYQFETAAEYKKTLESVEYVVKKQNVMGKSDVNRDVFSFHATGGNIAFATLIIRRGLLINCITRVIPLYEQSEDAFLAYVLSFYEKYRLPKEIVVPDLGDFSLLGEILERKIIVGKSGANLNLIQMGARNAVKAMEKELAVGHSGEDLTLVLDELQKRLNVKSAKTIELIDNSHIAGDANVSAVVVFVNGVPYKKMYRKYKVSEENKANDYGAMKEVVYRRYYRKLTEKQPPSDLILVDGGIAQVHATLAALTELEFNNVPVFGLVKNDKHQTRAILDRDGREITINDDKALFFMLTRMQDEVHRFAIAYHRATRSKSLTQSALDGIPGLGKKRRASLLGHFGSVEKIKEADVEELTQFVPLKVAREIKIKL